MNIDNIEQMLALAKSHSDEGTAELAKVYIDCYECLNIALVNGITISNDYDSGIRISTDPETLIPWNKPEGN